MYMYACNEDTDATGYTSRTRCGATAQGRGGEPACHARDHCMSGRQTKLTQRGRHRGAARDFLTASPRAHGTMNNVISLDSDDEEGAAPAPEPVFRV